MIHPHKHPKSNLVICKVAEHSSYCYPQNLVDLVDLVDKVNQKTSKAERGGLIIHSLLKTNSNALISQVSDTFHQNTSTVIDSTCFSKNI